MQSHVYALNFKGEFVTNRKSTMIFDENMEKVFVLDAIGLEIIKLIDGKRSVACIVEELSQKYTDTQKDILFNDVCEFIQLLCEKSICRSVNDMC